MIEPVSDRPRPAGSLPLDASPSEAQPCLLELVRRQAARRTPAELLDRYARDSFAQPSTVDLRALHELARLALEAADGYEGLQLSPVAPLGACSVVAPTSQDRVLSALRGTEVVADPTNVLALECARRLRAEPDADVRLCTVHQTLRAQPLPPVPGFARHFSLFAAVEAGRARADDGFEVAAAVRLMRVAAATAGAWERAGAALPERRLAVAAPAPDSVVAARVADALARAFPDLELVREAPLAHYYDGLRVRLDLVDPDAPGGAIPFGDLGRFDWVARLCSNRRLRYVASGFGLQMLASRYPRG